MFFSDRLKQLINADKLSGALVLYARNFTINGTNPPNSGSSEVWEIFQYVEDLEIHVFEDGAH
jgi:hypothetical protein